MNTQVTTTGANGAGNQIVTIDDMPLARAIGELKDKFAAALGTGAPVERFTRVALLAVTKPQIAEAVQTVEGRRSVYDALLRAATDGLLVDGREAALVVYRTKVKVRNATGGESEQWRDLVNYQSMVAGIRKKARNSGEIADIIAQCVYEQDPCDIEVNRISAEDGPPVKHKIDPQVADRGAFLGAYAYVRFKDGSYSQPTWMSKAQIDKIMWRTKSQKDGKIFGPWETDYEEMALKTVVRRGSKGWPSSSDREGVSLQSVISAGDDLTDLTIDHTPPPALPRKQPSAARMLTQEQQQAPAQDQQPPKDQAKEPASAAASSNQSDDPPGRFEDV